MDLSTCQHLWDREREREERGGEGGRWSEGGRGRKEGERGEEGGTQEDMEEGRGLEK